MGQRRRVRSDARMRDLVPPPGQSRQSDRPRRRAAMRRRRAARDLIARAALETCREAGCLSHRGASEASDPRWRVPAERRWDRLGTRARPVAHGAPSTPGRGAAGPAPAAWIRRPAARDPPKHRRRPRGYDDRPRGIRRSTGAGLVDAPTGREGSAGGRDGRRGYGDREQGDPPGEHGRPRGCRLGGDEDEEGRPVSGAALETTASRAEAASCRPRSSCRRSSPPCRARRPSCRRPRTRRSRSAAPPLRAC